MREIVRNWPLVWPRGTVVRVVEMVNWAVNELPQACVQWGYFVLTVSDAGSLLKMSSSPTAYCWLELCAVLHQVYFSLSDSRHGVKSFRTRLQLPVLWVFFTRCSGSVSQCQARAG
jgi:hypothetical protein